MPTWKGFSVGLFRNQGLSLKLFVRSWSIHDMPKNGNAYKYDSWNKNHSCQFLCVKYFSNCTKQHHNYIKQHNEQGESPAHNLYDVCIFLRFLKHFVIGFFFHRFSTCWSYLCFYLYYLFRFCYYSFRCHCGCPWNFDQLHRSWHLPYR